MEHKMMAGNGGRMILRFNLKQMRERERLTQIMLVATVDGRRVRAYTRLRVEPLYWDGSTYRCRVEACGNRRGRMRLRQINERLERLEECVGKTDEQLAERGEQLTAEAVRKAVHTHRQREEKSAERPMRCLARLVEGYVAGVNRKGRHGTESTRDTYRRALKRLQDYVGEQGREPASFEDFGRHFFEGFTAWLYARSYGRGTGRKKYTPNTIMNTLKVLKNLLHRAYDMEASTNDYFMKVRTALPHDTTRQVYLDEEEVGRLAAVYVLSDEEREVRDMFLIACYTALRISDIQRLNRAAIGRGVIALCQSKTKEQVEIPILKEIAPLVEHYSRVGFPVLRRSRANRIIKELCVRCGLDETVQRAEWRGGVVHTRTWRKYELVSFHTARRSCVTNLYKRGYPPNYIMAMSGHRSIQAFQRYMRAGSKELMEDFFRLLKRDKAV